MPEIIKDENFVNISGWMINNLKLKGNELLIYAIIYGFSQSENQKYTGSLQYLANWTCSTKQGVMKNLKSLIEKGYITKETKKINNVKFCEYCINQYILGGKQSLMGYETKFNRGMKQSLPNNNILENKEDNIYIVEQVINYMNELAGTNFKSTTEKTKSLIKARLKEGFTLDNMKDVVFLKYKDWYKHPKTFNNGVTSDTYFRPNTLFGTKFESYLQEFNKKAGYNEKYKEGR